MNILPNERSGIDSMAEGMWKVASGDITENWMMLPESQREWWRDCANYAIRLWMGPAFSGPKNNIDSHG